jgi:hypothetical protein
MPYNLLSNKCLKQDFMSLVILCPKELKN